MKESCAKKLRLKVLIPSMLIVGVVVLPELAIERARHVELISGRGKTEYKLFGFTLWTEEGARWPEPTPGTYLALGYESWVWAGSSGATLFGRGYTRCGDNGHIPSAHHFMESTLLEWDVDTQEIARTRLELAFLTIEHGPISIDIRDDVHQLWAIAWDDSIETKWKLWPIDPH